MIGSLRNPAQAYAAVGVQTGVIAADPHKLVLMLFDGALMTIASACRQMRDGNTAAKGASISRAIAIVNDGLKASLDMNVGGDLAARLAALYEYMCWRLLEANVHDDKEALEEVALLLAELKGAWEEIARKPAVDRAGAAAR